MRNLLVVTILIFSFLRVEAQSRFQLLHEMPLGISRWGHLPIVSKLQLGDTLFWVSGWDIRDSTSKVGFTNLRTGQYTVIADTLKNCSLLTKFGERILFYSYRDSAYDLWSWDTTNGLERIATDCDYINPTVNLNTNPDAPVYYFWKRDFTLWGLPINQRIPIQIGQSPQWLTPIQILRDSILTIETMHGRDSFEIWLFSPTVGNGRKIVARNMRLASQPYVSQSSNLIAWTGVKNASGAPNGNSFEHFVEELNLTTGIVSRIDTALSMNNFGNLPFAITKYQGNVLLYTKRGSLWAYNNTIATSLSSTRVSQIIMPQRRKSLFLVNAELWETDGITFNRILESSRYNNNGYTLYDLVLPDGAKLFTANDRTTSNTQAWLLHPDSTAPRLVGIMPRFSPRSSLPGEVTKFYYLNGSIYAFVTEARIIQVFKEEVNSPDGLRLIASYNTVVIQPVVGEVFWLNNKIVFSMLADFSKGKEYYSIENGNIALVKEVRKGSLGLHMAGQIQLGNELFFEATDGLNGVEQWTTDGTPEGTRMVENFSKGGRSSDWRLIGALDNDKLVLLNVNSKDYSVQLYLYNGSLPLSPLAFETPQTYEWNKLVGANINTDNRGYTNTLGLSQDSSGNIIHLIVGSCISYIDEGKTSRLYSGSDGNFYLCGSAFQISKRNSNGELLWAKSVGERYNSGHAPVMAVNRNGRIGIVLKYNYETYLDTLLFERGSQEENTIIAEFDTNGNLIWHKQLSLSGSPEVHSIVYDNENNLVLTGRAGTFDDNSGQQLVSTDNKNNFIASFAPNGNTRWVKHINSFLSGYPVRTSQMICDKENKIYLLASIPEGRFPGFCDRDSSEMYVLKFRSDNGVTDWSQRITAEQRCSFEWSGLDPDGNLNIRGMYNGNIVLPGGIRLSGTCEGYNYFAAVISPQGSIISADTLDNTKAYLGVYFSPKGVLYDVFSDNKPTWATFKEGYYHKYYHGYSNFCLKASIRGVTLRDYIFKYGSSNSGPFDNIRRPLVTFDKDDNIVLSTHSSGPLDTLPNFAVPESQVFTNGSYLHIVKFRPFSLSSPSAPDAQLAASDITLYPNPTTGYLVLQSDDRDFADMQYEVFDVLGRPIAALRGESYSIGYQSLDVTPFAQGTYFLRCTIGGKTITTLKFVKL